jgi:hypothetical protein
MALPNYDELEDQIDDGTVAADAAQPEPTLDDAYGSLEDNLEAQDADQNGRLTKLFQFGLQVPPDRRAGELYLARETGLKPDLIATQYDAFEKAATAAKFDPKRFRADHPDLAELLLNANPAEAGVVMMDEQVSGFTRAVRSGLKMLGEAAEAVGKTGGERGHLSRSIANSGMAGEGAKGEFDPEFSGSYSSPLKQVPTAIAPEADDKGLDRLSVFADSWGRQRKQSELSSLGAQLLFAEVHGDDTYELEKRIITLQQEVGPARFYDSGPVEQVLLDGLQAAGSQLDVFAGMGKGYGVGFALGALPTLIATRGNLKDAIRAGHVIGKLGGGAGAFSQSAIAEGGGLYLDLRTQKTDDGRPIDRDVARGAALVYGLLAGGVEMASLGPLLKTFGPLEAAIRAGEGKAFLRAMVGDQTKAAIFKDVAKAWAKGAAAEGAEGATQSALSDLTSWGAAGISDGEIQKFDGGQFVQNVVEGFYKEGVGGAFIGMAGSSVNVTSRIVHLEASRRSGDTVAVISGLPASAAARASPALVARIVEAETARSGQKVEALYVDAPAFVRLFQSQGVEPDQAARELMGEEGPTRLREALAGTNQGKLEVPLEEYLGRWGNKGVAEALAPDTAARPGAMTTRELQQLNSANPEALKQRADALVAQWDAAEQENRPIEPQSEAAERLTRAVQAQLIQTGVTSPKEARTALAATQAFLETLAEDFNLPADELFEHHAVKVERALEEADAQVAASHARAQQSPAPTPGGVTEITFSGPDLSMAERRDRARYAQRLQTVERLAVIPEEIFKLYAKRLQFHLAAAQADPMKYGERSAQDRADAEVYGKTVDWGVKESLEAARLREEQRRLERWGLEGRSLDDLKAELAVQARAGAAGADAAVAEALEAGARVPVEDLVYVDVGPGPLSPNEIAEQALSPEAQDLAQRIADALDQAEPEPDAEVVPPVTVRREQAEPADDRVVYHGTLLDHVDSIAREGLTVAGAKARRYWAPMMYEGRRGESVFVSSDEQGAADWARQMAATHRETGKVPVVLTVRLPADTAARLSQDEFGSGLRLEGDVRPEWVVGAKKQGDFPLRDEWSEVPLPAREPTTTKRRYQVQNLPDWEIKVRAWMANQGRTVEQVQQHIAAIRGQMKIFSALGPVELKKLPRGKGKNPGVTPNAKSRAEKGLKEGEREYPGGPLRSNEDDIYVLSFDLSAMCVKRLEAGATLALVQKRLNERAAKRGERARSLGPAEQIALAALFREAGKQAPCLYCYVEAPRQKSAELVDKAISIAFGEQEMPDTWADRTKQLARAAMTEVKQKNLKASDVNPAFFSDPAVASNPEELARRANAPALYAFMGQMAVSVTANKPKPYEEYTGQILEVPDSRIAELNSFAGFRFFSSSDFQFEHVADLMQAFFDLSIKKARSHAYTKVIDYVEIFGGTGQKIQTSVFAHPGAFIREEGGEFVVLEAPTPLEPPTGKVLFRAAKREQAEDWLNEYVPPGGFTQDDWQGMGWEDAKRLGKKYENVGSVLVATSDAQVRWALDQDWVHYIIPFHHSGMEARFFDEMGWKSFQSVQSETWSVKGKSGKPPKVRMHELLRETVGERAGATDEEMTKRYLKLCKERGVEPVFPQFKDHPKFAKLKKDYARTDTPFRVVEPRFNLKAAKRVLDAYFAGEAPAAAADKKLAKKLLEMIEKAPEGSNIGRDALRALNEGRDIVQTIRRLNQSLFRGVPAKPGEPDNVARFGPAYYYADQRGVAEVFKEHRGEGARVEEKDVDLGSLVMYDARKVDASTAQFNRFAAALGAELDIPQEAAADRLREGDILGIARDYARAQEPAWRAALAERRQVEMKWRKEDPQNARLIGPDDPRLSPATREAFAKRSLWPGQPDFARAAREAGYDGIILENEGYDDVPGHTEYAFFKPPPENVKRLLQPAAARPAGAAQIETPEFRKWFGQSKVVDANGRPLVVFHGTMASFTAFKPSEGSSLGFHFGSAEAANKRLRAAARWADGEEQILPVYVSIQNPLRVDDPGDWDAHTLAGPLVRAGVLTEEQADRLVASERGLTLAKLRTILEAKGYDGIVYDNVGEGGGDSYMALRPEQIKSAIGNRGTFDPNDKRILHQGKKDDAKKARAWVDIVREGLRKVFKISLTKRSDLSSFMHETGHTMLEMLLDLSERPDAPQRVKDNAAAALDWLGAPTRADITEEMEEKWARAFEAYLMEGKAPSPKLVEAFTRFRLWLLDVYRMATSLNVQLDDDIRGVFDRMLATDAEIELMKRTMGIDAPISPEAAGLAPEQYKAYLEDREKTFAKATLDTQRRVMADRARATEGWWKEKLEKAKEAALADYDKRPDVRALAYVKRGEMTLEDGRTVKDGQMGRLDREAVASLLGGRSVSVVKGERKVKLEVPADVAELLHGRIVKEGGEHPDDVAPRFGYENGRELLDALRSVPARDEWATAEAERRMQEAHPDILEEKTRITEEAARALHNAGTSDWLLKEYAALRQRGYQMVFNPEANKSQAIPNEWVGLPAAPIEAIRLAAKEIVRKMKLRGLSPHRALEDERRAAEQAAIAAAKGDYKLAAVHKQQQLLSHEIYRELEGARDRREAFEKLGEKLTDPKRRGVLGKFGRVYLDASDQILEALGFKDPENDPEVLATRQTMPEVMKALEAAGIVAGFDAAKLSWIVAHPPQGAVSPKGNPQPAWKELTVDDMDTVGHALAQLYTAARDANQVAMEGKKVELDALAQNIATEAAKRPMQPKPPGSNTAAKRGYWAKQAIQGFNAALQDPQVILEELGPTAYKFFWRGRNEAAAAEHVLAEKVGRFFLEKWDDLPEDLQAARYDLLADIEQALPLPADLNRDGKLRDREWLWMVALNMGNRSNMERLLGGYGWKEQQVREYLDKTLSDAEWTFLESVWGLLDDELWSKVAEQYEKVNGVRPPKIDALPFQLTSGRIIRGGYFPARYDPVASRVGANQDLEALQKMYGQKAGAISVAKSFTKERVKEYTDVINLQWSFVPSHVANVIHYVTHDSFTRDAARVLTHPTVKAAIEQRAGLKYYGQLMAWMRTVATAQNDAIPEELEDTYRPLSELKSRTVLASLGYSLTVAAADFTNPLVALAAGEKAGYVGRRHLAPVLLAALQPGGFGRRSGYRVIRDAALAKSKVLPRRADDARMMLRKHFGEVGVAGKKGRASRLLEATRDSAWIFMEMTDAITSTVIWEGAYRQALARGATDGEAILRADETVQRSLPSFDPAEQPALLRDKRGWASLIIFAGYGLKLDGVRRRVWRDAYEDWAEADGVIETAKSLASGRVAVAIGRTLALYFAANVLGELLSGRGPDEDEEIPEWILRKLAMSPLQRIPLASSVLEQPVNSGISYLFHGKAKWRAYSLRASPALSAVERLVKAGTKAAKGHELDEKLWALLEALGVVFKTPLGSSQVGRTGRYLTGQLADDIANGRWDEVGTGPIYGERSNGQSANPVTVFTRK